MKISEDVAEAYRHSTRDTAGRAGCLSSEALGRLAAGDVDDGERATWLDHVASCAECAVELRIAREATTWSRTRNDSRRPRSAPAFRSPIMAMAATLLMAVGLWLMWPQNEPVDHGVRGAGAEVLPANGAVVDQPPTVLEWPAQLGAQGYRVKILDAQGHLLWQSPILDEPVARPLWPGSVAGLCLWTVEVRGPVSRAELGPYRLTISDGP